MASVRRPSAELLAPAQRLRLVRPDGAGAAGARFAAEMFVAADGGPIRTLVGDGHRHFIGEEPSQKTGLSNPYEGPTEYALIVESELRADVLSFKTQAFRLRLMVGGTPREWICDHMRHIRLDGVDIVETIECKPDVSHLDADERAVQAAVGRVLAGVGWRHRVLYHEGIVGGGERQMNFGEIYAHQTAHVPDDVWNTFERICVERPDITFRDLRTALNPNRVTGTAMAHAIICRGRVAFDLDRYLFDLSPVRLLPPVDFKPLIVL